jgi:hypothetical protein
MTSTQPANVTHGFKLSDVSSIESRARSLFAPDHLGLCTLEQHGVDEVTHT